MPRVPKPSSTPKTPTHTPPPTPRYSLRSQRPTPHPPTPATRPKTPCPICKSVISSHPGNFEKHIQRRHESRFPYLVLAVDGEWLLTPVSEERDLGYVGDEEGEGLQRRRMKVAVVVVKKRMAEGACG